MDESIREKGAADDVMVDLARGISTRLTGGLSTNRNSIWSNDEQSVAFSSDRAGFYDVSVEPAGAVAEVSLPRKLFSVVDAAQAPQFTPDDHILVGEAEARSASRIDVTTACRAKAP